MTDYALLDRVKAQLPPRWLLVWEGDDCYSLMRETVKVLFWLRHKGQHDEALEKARRIDGAL